MGNVVQFKDKSGNNIYPIIIDGIREPSQKFDCCLGSHRGYCGEYPENTMIAFKAAVLNGYRYIETDVVQSSDGVQFLLHDATINRTSNGSGTVSNMSSTQLMSFDFGYSAKFGNKFSGTKIPTLKEFLIFCKRNRCVAELDLADDSRYSDSYLQNTYNVVKSVGMLDNVFFCAQLSRIEALLTIDPTVMVSVSGMTTATLMQTAAEIVKNCRRVTFSCNFNYINETLVTQAHNLNIAIKTWYNEGDGKDTSSNADNLFNTGVDFVLTDYVTPNEFQWIK